MNHSFAHKVALVAGGAGTVGSGIVKALLQQGIKKVIVPSRSETALKNLLEYCSSESKVSERLALVNADISKQDEREFNKILSVLQEEQILHLDVLVSCMGSWWQKGVPTSQPYSELLNCFHDLCGSHFIFLRKFLPMIKERQGTSYTIITGGAGGFLANAESGFTTVAQSALWGLSLAVRKECEKSPVRVNEARISISVVKDDQVKQQWEHATSDMGRSIVDGIVLNDQVRGQVVSIDSREKLAQLSNRNAPA